MAGSLRDRDGGETTFRMYVSWRERRDPSPLCLPKVSYVGILGRVTPWGRVNSGGSVTTRFK